MTLDEYLNYTEIKAVAFAAELTSLAPTGRRISPVMVSQWRTSDRQVPAEYCPLIEKATQGKVACETLRPDVGWAYLRGTESATV